MAKQRGLHQIKGKVGEYSYYSQTGVSGGLIRKINEGLSARVKNDEAYANTRLNNQEFGAAANVASLLGKTVTPKFRPMILPFSQSKMAKEILKVAREHTANWGQRVVTSDDTARLCEILSAMSKRDVTEFVSNSVARNAADEVTLGSAFTGEQSSLMASLGINSISVAGAVIDIATGQWLPLAGEMSTGYIGNIVRTRTLDDQTVTAGSESSMDNDVEVATFVPAPGHSGHQIIVFVVMPARSVNGVTHILQEYCSFEAIPLPVYVP